MHVTDFLFPKKQYLALFILVMTSKLALAGSLIINKGTGFTDATAVAQVGGNTGTTIGAQRANVFNEAASAWTNIVQPNANIVIDAQFTTLFCDALGATLGSAGPKFYDRDFIGAPAAATWYPRALKNHFTLASSGAAISAIFNSRLEGDVACMGGTRWYYGLDHNPGVNEIDLLEIVLHEFVHGLGFLTLVNLSDGTKSGGFDDVYMTFLRDNSLNKNWPAMTNAERVTSAKDNGDLVWSGNQVKHVASVLSSGTTNNYPRLYAPGTLSNGSSVSHWDDNVTYQGGANELMEHQYNTPYDMALTVALLRDLGWGNAIYDFDNDAVTDDLDDFPASYAASVDTDADGKPDDWLVASGCVGSSCDGLTLDDDNDNDSVLDGVDNCPLSYGLSSNQLDTDGDLQGNVCDSDDDNDGLSDSVESDLGSNPLLADTDSDNITDKYDADPLDDSLLLIADGTAKSDRFASAIAVADMNADGYDDIIVGSPLADVTIGLDVVKDAGVIEVISGKDGTLLPGFSNLHGTVAKQQFGSAIAVVPDQSIVPDGKPDLVIGNPFADIIDPVSLKAMKDAGNVSIYDSASGNLITSIADGSAAGDKFGAAVAIGDVDNDATDDLVVGAPGVDIIDPLTLKAVKDTGRVTVYDGISSTELYTRVGAQAKELFGSAVAVNTVDNWLLVGSPGFDVLLPTKLMDVGQVQIFDGTDGGAGAALLPVPGSVKGDKFGSSVTSFNSDTDDADPGVDWAVGIPFADIYNAATSKTMKDAGKVQFFSGLSSTVTLEKTGTLAADNFGAAMDASGDTNNDAKNNLVIGIPKFDTSLLLKDTGRVEVH